MRMSETVRHHKQLQRELMQELDRMPGIDELAEASGLSPRRVAFALQVGRQIVSLDSQGGEDTDDLGALLPDVVPDPVEQVAQHLLQAELEQALLDLPTRDYQVLALRFGLAGARQHSLLEVGEHLGISRERARRLEQLALLALRRRLDGEDGPPQPLAPPAILAHGHST
jgi:RNA polymerase sigma factor (sigma-70 family)